MTHFINISGIGIYRADLIRHVSPSTKDSYNIQVQPPMLHDEEFKVIVTKIIDVTPSIYLEGEDEPVFDEKQANIVYESISFDMAEILPSLLPNPKKGENEVASEILKKMKNYKIRLKKIADYEKQYENYDSAKGSPTYDSIMQNLRDNAPTNDGQEERVQKIKEVLQEKLDGLISKGKDSDIISSFGDSSEDERVKEAANDLMNYYTKVLNNTLSGPDFKSYNESYNDEEDGNFGEVEDESLEEEEEEIPSESIKDRLNKLPPEDAAERAFNILESKDYISNSQGEEDEADHIEETEVEEDDNLEDDEEELIDIKPKSVG